MIPKFTPSNPESLQHKGQNAGKTCSDSQAKYVVRKASPEDIDCETTFTPGENDYDHSVEDTSVSTYNESH